jgi:hypothetical protein
MIKTFKQFITEEVSGTELVGPVGPAYGETRLQNKTINGHHTNLIYSELDGGMYSIDDYNQMYHSYLQKGGKPLHGFSKENIDTIVSFLGEN